MPQGVFPITQRETTITRSVARDVCKDLIKKWSFPSDAKIIFNELQGSVKLNGNIFEPCMPPLNTDYNNYLFVEYNESFMESGFNRDNVLKNNHLNLFKDNDIGVDMRPIYMTMKMELNLKFRSRDLTMLTALKNILKFSDTDRMLIQKHDIFYDYNIPDKLLYLSTLANTLRNKNGDDTDLKTYLKSRFKEGVTVRTNIGASHVQPICQECQKNVMGLSRESAPYNALEISEGIYELSIPYEIHYQQPICLEVSYPIMIHNQFIGMANVNMIEDHRMNVSDDKNDAWTPVEYLEVQGRPDISRYYRPDGGKRLVPFDDWYPKCPSPNTTTICIAPVTVDEKDNNKVADLNSLPDDVLSQDIKDYLKANQVFGAKYPRSLIVVEVFETYGMERSLDFTIDEDLVVRTLASLDSRYRVHVRVSLSNDWSTIHNDAMLDILRNPEMTHNMAKLLDSRVELIEVGNGGPLTKEDHLVSSNDIITKHSMRNWLVSLPTVNMAFKRAPGKFSRTVLFNNLTVRK